MKTYTDMTAEPMGWSLHLVQRLKEGDSPTLLRPDFIGHVERISSEEDREIVAERIRALRRRAA